jgi:hypothetical protein
MPKNAGMRSAFFLGTIDAKQEGWTEMGSVRSSRRTLSMRKMWITALVFGLIFGTAVIAMAKDTTRMAKGTAATVNAADNSLTVKGTTHEGIFTEIFTVSNNTKITENGKPIKLADVRKGDGVQVWYTMTANRNEASKVLVQPMNPAKTGRSR